MVLHFGFRHVASLRRLANISPLQAHGRYILSSSFSARYYLTSYPAYRKRPRGP